MPQYQSFPDASGDSRTLDKLKALQLPDLSGRSFLDIGCNEGFFCGFASFLGAAKSVGIDHSAGFIERATRRFPQCEFHCQDWQSLPVGMYDVILLASALHYADDQEELIRRLVSLLTPDGVLILEMGIVSSKKSEWRRVKRGIDERDFPSMRKLKEVLSGYAWKWMGPSISQDGDPVPRHVIHISRRRPVAYLLMQPPGYGKSSLANRIFPQAGITVISGDQRIQSLAHGKSQAAPELEVLVRNHYSPFHLDKMIQRIFESGRAHELIDYLIDAAEGEDIALDAYVPHEHQPKVETALKARGYLPLRMEWERVGPSPLPADTIATEAESFYLSMMDVGSANSRDGQEDLPPVLAGGFVDEVDVDDNRVVLRGWAVGRDQQFPSPLEVRIGGRKVPVAAMDKQLRPDVQRHLGLAHALVGYRLELEVGHVMPHGRVIGELKVLTGAGVRLQFSEQVASWLSSKPTV